MQLDEWADRWSAGQIGFHQDNVTGALQEFGEQVFGPDLGRVLVPLCGKTLDMVHLAERADLVIGVEYVEQAVVEFFDERNLVPDVDAGPPQAYTSENYVIFASDIFLVGTEHTGLIDSVFDRAALVALDPPTRKRYAEHISSLLPTGAKVLLLTYPYDQSQMNGPPFAVPDTEVYELFGDTFEIEHLRSRDVLDERFRERGLDAMGESTFAMTRV